MPLLVALFIPLFYIGGCEFSWLIVVFVVDYDRRRSRERDKTRSLQCSLYLPIVE